ncbi:LOW QUALITY PROTEIN: hypothetical protein CRUP_026789 [Coryphaenoides rupestris]|nr:LOW QUALITY PROTEIN: hypothetical protein CRUP_026789 [Coryphaenoides rupestris]
MGNRDFTEREDRRADGHTLSCSMRSWMRDRSEEPLGSWARRTSSGSEIHRARESSWLLNVSLHLQGLPPWLYPSLPHLAVSCQAPPLHPSPSSHLQGGELSGEGLLHGGQALAEGQVVRLHGGGGRRVHLLPSCSPAGWQGVVRRAQQRRGIIDGLVRQWQRYRDMADKLRRWLLEVAPPLPAATDTAPDTAGTGPLRSGATVPLQQARAMLDAIQVRPDPEGEGGAAQQEQLILTVEAGRSCSPQTAGRRWPCRGSSTLIHERAGWHANASLDAHKRGAGHPAEGARRFETNEQTGSGVSVESAGLWKKLRAFKRQLSQPLPDLHEDLQGEQMRCKELESRFAGWTDDLAHLSLLRESLACYIGAEDLSVLPGAQWSLLQRQWEGSPTRYTASRTTLSSG